MEEEEEELDFKIYKVDESGVTPVFLGTCGYSESQEDSRSNEESEGKIDTDSETNSLSESLYVPNNQFDTIRVNGIDISAIETGSFDLMKQIIQNTQLVEKCISEVNALNSVQSLFLPNYFNNLPNASDPTSDNQTINTSNQIAKDVQNMTNSNANQKKVLTLKKVSNTGQIPKRKCILMSKSRYKGVIRRSVVKARGTRTRPRTRHVPGPVTAVPGFKELKRTPGSIVLQSTFMTKNIEPPKKTYSLLNGKVHNAVSVSLQTRSSEITKTVSKSTKVLHICKINGRGGSVGPSQGSGHLTVSPTVSTTGLRTFTDREDDPEEDTKGVKLIEEAEIKREKLDEGENLSVEVQDENQVREVKVEGPDEYENQLIEVKVEGPDEDEDKEKSVEDAESDISFDFDESEDSDSEEKKKRLDSDTSYNPYDDSDYSNELASETKTKRMSDKSSGDKVHIEKKKKKWRLRKIRGQSDCMRSLDEEAGSEGDSTLKKEMNVSNDNDVGRKKKISRSRIGMRSNLELLSFTAENLFEMVIEQRSDSEFVCRNCKKIFQSKEEAFAHTDEHHPFKCKICNKKFRVMSILKSHMNTKHAEYFYCTFCSFYCKKETRLKEHVQSKHSLKQNEPRHDKDAVCYVCGQLFATDDAVNLHMERIHKEKNSLRVGDFNCPICNKVYRSRCGFRRHMNDHAGKFRFCPYKGCDFKTSEGSKLTRHCNQVHLGKGLIPCPVEGCPKHAKRNLELQDHLNTVHYKIRRFECTTCHKKFMNKKYLSVHERIHSAVKPMGCNFCEYRCCQRASLDWHMKKRHPDKTNEKAPTLLKWTSCRYRPYLKPGRKQKRKKEEGTRKKLRKKLRKRKKTTPVDWEFEVLNEDHAVMFLKDITDSQEIAGPDELV